jgi:hypothetical protein
MIRLLTGLQRGSDAEQPVRYQARFMSIPDIPNVDKDDQSAIYATKKLSW